MKSILQEANSIERAIDKAWNQAGKPKEFSIKVLDEGERNFLGLSRRPAIVTILYKPERVTSPQNARKEDRSPSEREDRRERRERSYNNRDGRAENGGQNRQQEQRRQEQSGTRRYAGTDEQRVAFQNSLDQGWREQWKDYVVTELRELLRMMGITVVIEAGVTNDKTLTITFAHPVLDNDEEQRMLFATLSYLGLQLLKRMYKSRFIGYKILVTGPKADGSSMSADSEDPLPRAFDQRPSPQARNHTQPREDRGDRIEGVERSDRSERSGRGDRRRDGDRRPRRDRDRERAPRIGAPDPFATDHVTAAVGHGDDIAADQMRFAQQQLSKEEKKPAAPVSKKDKKYPPFFVLDEQESNK